MIGRWSLFVGIFLSLGSVAARAQFVDLHAHLFFHEGQGVRWFGGFDQPIEAQSWADRVRSKVNEAELVASQVQIVGVALYAHPLSLGSERDQIRRQIEAAKGFVTRDSNWIIARNASQAESAIKAGKRILVLTLEGASGVLETEDDLKEFIDHDGVSIVTPVHFMDDEYGGVALMPGWRVWASPIGFLRAFWDQNRKEGIWLNPVGLRLAGKWLIEELIKRHVWIDLAHSSDQFQDAVVPQLLKAGQPLLHTHTMIRKHYEAERGISNAQLEQVRKSDGLVGLIPSEDLVGSTPHAGPCKGGVGALAQQWREASAILGEERLTLSSDINAPIQFLPPDCKTHFPDKRGFYRYGQWQELWQQIQPQARGLTVQRFLRTWGRVDPRLGATGNL